MRGALVPHAPLLLPEVTTKTEDLRDIWDGLSRVRIAEGDLVVVLTPHAETTGVYAAPAGSLSDFGLPEVSGKWEASPEATGSLPVIGAPLDHGALVPLLLLGVTVPVCAIGVTTADLASVVDVVRDLAAKHEVFVLVSAHTSACLTERAPLPYSFDALRLESRLITDLETDCVAARDAAEVLATVGGSCSRFTLATFGMLFAGAAGNVLAYGSPFGVGYPVVTAEVDV